MPPRTAYRLNRRDILTGFAGLACTLAQPMRCATAMARKPETTRAPGLQLYTLRDSMAQNLEATLDAVAAMGFSEVEFAGYFDRKPQALRAILDERGLRAPSSHVHARTLRDDPERLLDAAATLGNRFVTIGWLDQDDRTSISDYQRWAAVLNRVGGLGRDRGLKAAYHNHEFEFEPINEVVPYDVLLDQTEAGLVDFELDFYWVRKAGLDIESILNKAPGRFRMAHIKDMDDQGAMVDVGRGQIDFQRVLQSRAASSLQHLFVEHDQPAYPFRTAAVGRRHLSQILAAI